MSGRRQRAGRGALWLIAGLLCASALLRFGSGTGAAIARELDAFRPAADLEAAPAAPAQAAAPPDVEIAALMAELRGRTEHLEARERAVQTRMAALALAEEEVARNIARLEQAEADLRATMALADTAAEDDLARLTAVYENMKPEDASPLFQQMSPEFAAGFLGRMRPDAAAAILSGLAPETAYTISVILAGRNANAPRAAE